MVRNPGERLLRKQASVRRRRTSGFRTKICPKRRIRENTVVISLKQILSPETRFRDFLNRVLELRGCVLKIGWNEKFENFWIKRFVLFHFKTGSQRKALHHHILSRSLSEDVWFASIYFPKYQQSKSTILFWTGWHSFPWFWTNHKYHSQCPLSAFHCTDNELSFLVFLGTQTNSCYLKLTLIFLIVPPLFPPTWSPTILSSNSNPTFPYSEFFPPLRTLLLSHFISESTFKNP